MKVAPALLAVGVALSGLAYAEGGDAAAAVESGAEEIALIAPAASTHTGLLLEPPLELAWYTREKFLEQSSTVGAERIGKAWTSPVVPLRAPAPSGKQGLSEDDVKKAMLEAKELFDAGKAIPMSDVGLISTQEDVIRRPMLNHIAAFENDAVRAYLLVQKTSTDKDWAYFSIVQDMTVDPPRDYYAQVFDDSVRFEGTSCYKCHSSGPLAIHPAREDLVLDARLAAALSARIAEQPRSEFVFPAESPRPPRGKRLKLDACTACHDKDGLRAPLYQVHSHPIRILVDFGYMPPGEQLSAREIAELKAWLEDVEKTDDAVEAQ